MSAERQPWQLRHVAVVVRDLEPAIQHYTALGVCAPGSFRIHDVEVEATYRGRPVPLKLKLALARMGEVQLELIEAHPGDNPYWDFLKEKGEGLHHLAFTVADLEAEVALAVGKGVGVLLRGQTGRGGFAYLDCAAPGGTYIELMQMVERPS